MTWWNALKAELNSRLAPNRSPYAGQQPIGRNIWGQVGAVDTHYPVTKPFAIPRDAAWVDRNGNIVNISVSNQFYTKPFEYQLDHDNWNGVRNQASDEELGYIEQKLKDKGFFHVSELPPELRTNVDTQGNEPQYPPILKHNDIPREVRGTGEAVLLPPHIYHYEPVPDENYSLDYDTGGHYLPPYNPNAPKYEGEHTPKDYDGEMPPVGDTGREEQFDDYLSYAPPVDDDVRGDPLFLQKATPELIPLIPDWLDYTGDYDGYQPTAQHNILYDLLALARA